MHRANSTKIPALVLMMVFSIAVVVQADPYEVLVVDIAAAEDKSKITAFEKDARYFNGLHSRGYEGARPYFSLLEMSSGQVYLVFGFRGEVQGIHRRNYPATEKNLRRLKINGKLKYPDMHWLSIEEIRKRLKAP